MTLKKSVPRQLNIRIVILGVTFLLALLISIAGSSEVKALPAGQELLPGDSPLETPTDVPTLEATETPVPTETPTEIFSPPETLTMTPVPSETPSPTETATVMPPPVETSSPSPTPTAPSQGQYPPGQWANIIENQEFTQTLYLDTGDDNTLILNATFHDIEGSALEIRGVSNVTIKNCTIYNVSEDGIVLRSTGSTRNVTIEGCTIYNTGFNGILAKQNETEGVDHQNLVIKNNTLYDIGTDEYNHGMYIFSTDSLIENNTVYNTTGNGISIRSSGIVRGNKIWDTRESCIKYYGNHAPGVSNALYIENNVCRLAEPGLGDPGISMRRGDDGTEAWLVENYYIRFNTVVLLTDKRYGFLAGTPEIDPKHIEVYGNIFINTETIFKSHHPQYVDYLSSNYASTHLTGFVNPHEAPYDFSLTADSPARFYASGEPQFPTADINSTQRIGGALDAGAYQFTGPPTEVTETPTPVEIPVETATPTETPSATPVPTEMPGLTPAPTETPSATPVPTEMPGVTPAPTEIATVAPTPTGTVTATSTPPVCLLRRLPLLKLLYVLKQDPRWLQLCGPLP